MAGHPAPQRLVHQSYARGQKQHRNGLCLSTLSILWRVAPHPAAILLNNKERGQGLARAAGHNKGAALVTLLQIVAHGFVHHHLLVVSWRRLVALTLVVALSFIYSLPPHVGIRQIGQIDKTCVGHSPPQQLQSVRAPLLGGGNPYALGKGHLGDLCCAHCAPCAISTLSASPPQRVGKLSRRFTQKGANGCGINNGVLGIELTLNGSVAPIATVRHKVHTQIFLRKLGHQLGKLLIEPNLVIGLALEGVHHEPPPNKFLKHSAFGFVSRRRLQVCHRCTYGIQHLIYRHHTQMWFVT